MSGFSIFSTRIDINIETEYEIQNGNLNSECSNKSTKLATPFYQQEGYSTKGTFSSITRWTITKVFQKAGVKHLII